MNPLLKQLRRRYCRLFHNAFMKPRQGFAICRLCQEVWKVDLPHQEKISNERAIAS